VANSLSYRTVVYDQDRPFDFDVPAEIMLNLPHVNGEQGWEIVWLDDSDDGLTRTLWLRRRRASSN
jgi:hypothetical protein